MLNIYVIKYRKWIDLLKFMNQAVDNDLIDLL